MSGERTETEANKDLEAQVQANKRWLEARCGRYDQERMEYLASRE